MRISTLGSLRLKLEAARRKESAKKGIRRKGKIEFTKESGQLILNIRIMKVWSKGIAAHSRMKSTAINLAVWNLRMVDHNGKGLVARGLPTRDLVVRGITERNLIAKGDTERSPNTMNLIIATVMGRWKI
jgi:hypothetical protein